MAPSNGGIDASIDAELARLVRADQLASVRRSVQIAIPVNVLIGLIGTLVALHSGRALEGCIWFAASSAINLVRLALCRLADEPGAVARTGDGGASMQADRRLRSAGLAALASGIVWACLPALSDGYTSAETLFYLTVTCGITAGAVTHGAGYARIPLYFITPPLVTASAYLVRQGEFDRVCLAFCISAYLLALGRSALQSEAAFCEASRLKNEATVLARSLASANQRATQVADEMRLRATRDSLTGLLNRAGFISEVEGRMGAGQAASCLMLLDLDGFKSVNDAFGHSTGDRVLQEVAHRLARTLHAGSSIARLGGDEFAVFYELSTADEAPTDLADRLIAATVLPFETFNAGRLGISIGIYQASCMPLAEMLICADEALYAAKANGRNRSCMFDDTLRRRLEMRRDSERDLPEALAECRLEVWFQPIFDQGGRMLSGFEALVRWRHPKHGWVAPPDLIASAAMAGLSEPLLRFIVEQACDLLSWLNENRLERIQVSVNLSPREIAQLPVDEIVLSALSRSGLSPALLEVEITEEVAMNIVAVRHKLANLSAAGVRLAVDDFGVGFSSLGSLRHLRPDRVKIDRCFVTGIARSPDDQVLVQAILGLGRSMGFDVVAEGVESADDLVTLQAAGCRLMQGYDLGRPMPVSSLRDWVRRGALAAA